MQFESSYHWSQIQFVMDYLHLDLKQNKTVNNVLDMKDCGSIMVRDEIDILPERPTYVIGNNLSFATKSVF